MPEQLIVTSNESMKNTLKKFQISWKIAKFALSSTIEMRRLGRKFEIQLNKFPYMLIVGEKETAENTVAVCNRVEGDTGSITIETFIEKIQAEIEASSSKFEGLIKIDDHSNTWRRITVQAE